jgi:type IV pilus assembly protein PilW
MVAMTLSLVLLAGALSILYSTKLTSSENDRTARIQEGGRTALELILQDARASGYAGCAKSGFGTYYTNGIASNTTLALNFGPGQPVYGFHGTGTAWSPTLDSSIPTSPVLATTGDVLVVRAATPGAPVFRTNAGFDPGTDIPVARDPNLALTAGTTAIIADCTSAMAFVVTSFSGTGSTATISHGTTGSPTNQSSNFNHNFQVGSVITPIRTTVYYVANCDGTSATNCPGSAATPPALWRIVAGGAPQELVRGVEAMQVRYGVDTNGDLLADSYVTANNVTNWGNVVSLNIALLVRSIDNTGTELDGKTYSLLGVNYGPFNDRRKRSVFTTTVVLRNQTP